MRKRYLLLNWSIFLYFMVFGVQDIAGQSNCPSCEVSLPDSLPGDTIFLGEAPKARVGEWYSGEVSFRVPRTTTPVAANDPETPAGLTIQRIRVNTLSNLPPGLSWEVSQREFSLPEETDGCVRFCGVPLQAGLYLIEVIVTARVFIFDESTSFVFPLEVEPSQSASEGFVMRDYIGCGQVEASFENKIPSQGLPGFTYRWDFGNGNASLSENPVPQRYSRPGQYPVSYEAIVDTAGYYLTNVRIEEVGCGDPFGNAPDLQIKLIDPDGKELLLSEVRENSRPPLVFDLNLPVGAGNYAVQVLDDDGLFGKVLCGTLNFNRGTQGTITNGEAKISLQIIHPIDTIRSTDTVVVYPQPAPPVLELLTPMPYCAGDTLELQASYNSGLQWWRDSLPLETVEPVLAVSEPGLFRVAYTSPDGCRAESESLQVDFASNPLLPVLGLERNRLFLIDSLRLPEKYRLDWFLEGQFQGSSREASWCVDRSGTYTVVITDENTGCQASSSLDAGFNPTAGDCLSTSVDVFGELVQNLRLFPNPTAGELNLEFYLEQATPWNWRLFNAQGQALRIGQGGGNVGFQRLVFQLDDLPGGLYWLELQAGEARKGFPLRLQK